MAPSNAKSARNVDLTLRPDSRLAFHRQVHQTHGTHGTQGIIFADELKEFRIELIEATLNRCILAIRIVKHIVTAFERREVPRRRIRMALD